MAGIKPSNTSLGRKSFLPRGLSKPDNPQQARQTETGQLSPMPNQRQLDVTTVFNTDPSFVVNITLPNTTNCGIVPTNEKTLNNVTNDDISNVITRIFNIKTFRLYIDHSVYNIVVTLCHKEGELDFGKLWSD
jgi:hypothetical protein